MPLESSRGVQQHDIDAAADALLALRLRPTVERVRQRIGRGSPNRVGPMLERWFAGLAPRLGVPAAGEGAAHDAAPLALRQALQEMWTQALKAAREEAAAAAQEQHERLALERGALEEGRAQLQRSEAALAEREAALQQALELVKTQLREQSARLEATTHQLAQARSSLANLVQERDAERRRLDAQTEAAAQERERLHTRAQASERHLLEEVDRARQEAKQARTELAAGARRHEGALAAAQVREQAAVDALGLARLEIATLRERLGALQPQADALARGKLRAGRARQTGKVRTAAVRS